MRRLLLLPAPLLLLACKTVPEAQPLDHVRSWAIQLHGDPCDSSAYDLLVLDPSMKPRQGKLCLAYVNVGQAERYRPYWKTFWRAPDSKPGVPDYLLAADPDGWADNYLVAYWDPRWQALLWGGAGAAVDDALEQGFDGVFLDWALAYREPAVAAAGPDAERAMARLVADLAAYARRKRPGAVVLVNNGALLAARSPEVRRAIDGVVQESLTFAGRPGAAWDDADAGGIPQEPSAELRLALADLRCRVFTLDYATREEDAREARAASAAKGYVPFVSRISLDRLP